jgi:hypothetical protein
MREGGKGSELSGERAVRSGIVSLALEKVAAVDARNGFGVFVVATTTELKQRAESQAAAALGYKVAAPAPAVNGRAYMPELAQSVGFQNLAAVGAEQAAPEATAPAQPADMASLAARNNVIINDNVMSLEVAQQLQLARAAEAARTAAVPAKDLLPPELTPPQPQPNDQVEYYGIGGQ